MFVKIGIFANSQSCLFQKDSEFKPWRRMVDKAYRLGIYYSSINSSVVLYKTCNQIKKKSKIIQDFWGLNRLKTREKVIQNLKAIILLWVKLDTNDCRWAGRRVGRFESKYHFTQYARVWQSYFIISHDKLADSTTLVRDKSVIADHLWKKV